MTEPATPAAPRRRNRIALLALLALFVVPILAAMLINFSGHRPAATRQHGELLQPPVDLAALTPKLADGADYAWQPDTRTWRIVVAPPPDCGDACTALARQLDTVWRLFGRNADRVHVLWLCPPGTCVSPRTILPAATLRVLVPDSTLRSLLPGVDDPRGAPVYVIDPNGFVVLRYPPGFDPAGLRADMAKLLKLM